MNALNIVSNFLQAAVVSLVAFGFTLMPFVGQLSVPTAQAATTSIEKESATLDKSSDTYSSSTDTVNFQNLTLSFNYDATKLDQNDGTTTLNYTAGSASDSVDITGKTGNQNSESGSVTLNNVPSKKNLQVTISVDPSGISSSPSSDFIKLTNITVSGDKKSQSKPVQIKGGSRHDTIKSALSNAQDGDTIIVSRGDYTSEGWIPIKKSVKLKAKSKHKPKVGRFTIKAPNVTIDGFEVVGDGADYNGISVEPNNGATSSIVIKDNHIHGIGNAGGGDGTQAFGILAWASGDNTLNDITIKDNKIQNIGAPTAQGFGVFVEDLGHADSYDGAMISGNTIKNIKTATFSSDTYHGTAIAVLPELTNPSASTTEGGIVTDNANATLKGNNISGTDIAISVAGDLSQFSMSNSKNKIKDGIPLLTRGTNPSTGSIGITDLQNSQSVVSNPGSLDLSSIAKNNDLHQAAYNTANPKATIWSSIQDAINRTKSGDVVKVWGGTYNESISIGTNDLTLKGVNSPTIIGDGVGKGGQPHAAIHVDDGNGPTRNVAVEGFTVRNPNGKFGIFAGTGSTNSSKDGIGGLVIQNNIVEDISTKSSGGSLTGGPAGISIRGDYGTGGNSGIKISGNKVSNVHTSGYTNAVGITLKNFTGDAGFGKDSKGADVTDQSSPPATDTDILNNKISNIDGGDNSRTKGVSVSGEFKDVLVKGNTISGLSAAADNSAGNALGITFTENGGSYNGNKYDTDSDGNGERIGPRNFTIKNNKINKLSAKSQALLFIGGYENLGNHSVRKNSFLDTSAGVDRYAQKQPGFQPGDEDELGANKNYWGHPTGPSGAGSGIGAKVGKGTIYKPFYVDPNFNVLSTKAKAVNSGSVNKSNNKATVKLSTGSGGATTVSVKLPSGSSASNITAVKSSGPTGNASKVNNSVTYLDISADKNVTGTTTVTVKVSASKISSPQNVVIQHHTGNKWQSLSTTHQSTKNGQATFTAQASGLSPFALVQKQPSGNNNNNDNQSDDTDDSSSGGFVNNEPPASTQGQVAGVATTTTQQAGKVLGAQDTNTQESLQDMLVRAKIQLLKLQVKLLRARLQ